MVRWLIVSSLLLPLLSAPAGLAAQASEAPPDPPPPPAGAAPAPAPAPEAAPATQPASSDATAQRPAPAPAAPTFPTVPDAGPEHPSAPPAAGAPGYSPPPPPPPPPPYAPHQWGFGLSFGFAFGGDELLGATRSDGRDASLAAGDGVHFALVADYTPLHLGEGQWLNLGIDVEAGIKMAGLSGENGSVDLGRFPLIAKVHSRMHLGSFWHLALAAGVQYDAGIFLSGDGIFADFDVDLGSAVGAVGEAGVFYQDAADSAGYSLVLRYVHMEYDDGDLREPVDASSFGFAMGVMYLL